MIIIFRENLSFKSVENQVMAAVVNVKCESVKTVELSVKKEEISHVDIKTEPSDKEEDDLDLNHFEVEVATSPIEYVVNESDSDDR